MNDSVARIESQGCESCKLNDYQNIDDQYLGGESVIHSLWTAVQTLKGEDRFFSIFTSLDDQKSLENLTQRLSGVAHDEAQSLAKHMGHIPTEKVKRMSARIEKLKDIAWCLQSEIIDNLEKIRDLSKGLREAPTLSALSMFKKINAVLNSIDRLEVRGRDSAGVSLMFVFTASEFEDLEKSLQQADLIQELNQRCYPDPLTNRGISIHHSNGGSREKRIAIAFTYKVAAEVGSLGDNIGYLRRQIATDSILQALSAYSPVHDTISAHTRWASVGAITEANCHPVDNQTRENSSAKNGIIHTCLNGDIDNFQSLKADFERNGDAIHEHISTDTKIYSTRTGCR
jgi:glucosamine--fructose-6-phosphate aminotransferase (isomerizing)